MCNLEALLNEYCAAYFLALGYEKLYNATKDDVEKDLYLHLWGDFANLHLALALSCWQLTPQTKL